MNLTIEDLKKWQPDRISEDHVDNLILRLAEEIKFLHLVYYNPPHGSWKTINLVHNGKEYRQVGPKRGVGNLRRPDLAFQDIRSGNTVRLLLIESKLSSNSWNKNIPEEMKAYFEGVTGFNESKGIRRLPFRHSRRIGTIQWEEITEENPDRNWFINVEPEYMYGFAYSLGQKRRQFDLSDEKRRIERMISEDQENLFPMVVMAVGWAKEDFSPFVVRTYSSSFPRDIRELLEETFSRYNLGESL